MSDRWRALAETKRQSRAYRQAEFSAAGVAAVLASSPDEPSCVHGWPVSFDCPGCRYDNTKDAAWTAEAQTSLGVRAACASRRGR